MILLRIIEQCSSVGPDYNLFNDNTTRADILIGRQAIQTRERTNRIYLARAVREHLSALWKSREVPVKWSAS